MVKPASKTNPLRLIEARNKEGWTQTEVAERIGVDTNTVSRWERGEAFPNHYACEQLTAIYGKSLEELGLVRGARVKRASRNKSSHTQAPPTIPYEDLAKRRTPIIGREQKIERTLKFLQEDKRPLVTITG